MPRDDAPAAMASLGGRVADRTVNRGSVEGGRTAPTYGRVGRAVTLNESRIGTVAGDLVRGAAPDAAGAGAPWRVYASAIARSCPLAAPAVRPRRLSASGSARDSRDRRARRRRPCRTITPNHRYRPLLAPRSAASSPETSAGAADPAGSDGLRSRIHRAPRPPDGIPIRTPSRSRAARHRRAAPPVGQALRDTSPTTSAHGARVLPRGSSTPAADGPAGTGDRDFELSRRTPRSPSCCSCDRASGGRALHDAPTAPGSDRSRRSALVVSAGARPVAWSPDGSPRPATTSPSSRPAPNGRRCRRASSTRWPPRAPCSRVPSCVGAGSAGRAR